jgi:cytochrome P450
MLNGDPKNGTEPLSDAAIKVEVNGLTFAAVDTTSNGMSYLLYELSCNPEWQDRLRTELWEANVIKASFANNLLKDLPVLNACIHETLRLHPPAFSSLPRITPPEGFTVDGLWVPGNVRANNDYLQ